MKMRLIQLFMLLMVAHFNYAQVVKFGFNKLLEQKPDKQMPFAIVYEGQQTLDLLKEQRIVPKKLTKEWVYVTATPAQIDALNKAGAIKDFYFENSHPALLNDSTRVKAHVNEVHQGSDGLSMPYTGKGVIVGLVDDGIDFRHPDFRDANGNTRFLYLWDHALDSAGHANIPQPYNYGLVYSANDINQHISAGMYPGLGGQSFHGSNVTGIAAGNGLANGTNKGMAPDAQMIFVRTNFGLSNWTMSVADACQFIFDKADELGMPCVINMSVGGYFGSHDGEDPAAEMIEALVDEKPGRIVVCAAGNSGNVGKYHVGGDVDSDTSFVWFKNNPNGGFGPNTVVMDLWADQTQIQNVRYSLGANLPSGSFESRAQTVFFNPFTALGGVIFDTLRNSNGDQIATLELYPGIQYGKYNLTVFFSHVDSVDYFYRFSTTSVSGTGHYDLWTGTAFGYNDVVENVPTAAQYPPIVHYHPVDLLQSVVSSWGCSEKVITVGNFVNRQGYTNLDGDFMLTPVTAGTLSVNSSKGPARNGTMKPDISAPGDFTATATTLDYLAEPVHSFRIEQGGWHQLNGGTSMASPVIAGIAALYLEKCNRATYANFKTDLIASAFGDAFTGTLPNTGFGYGKPHALNTLLQKSYDIGITGPAIFCGTQSDLGLTSSTPLDSAVWHFGATQTNANQLTLTSAGFYTVYTYDGLVCSERDTVTVTQGNPPAAPVISYSGSILSSSTAPNYQWYSNGNPIVGQTFQNLIGTVGPNIIYQVATTGPDGCKSFSNVFQLNAGLMDETLAQLMIYPNPVESKLQLESLPAYEHFSIRDLQGKILFETAQPLHELNVEKLAKGVYLIQLVSENKIFTTKFEKM